MNFENIIFSNLVFNEKYARKVIAFLQPEYFDENSPDRVIFETISDYVNKYSSFPSVEALLIDLSNKTGLDEKVFQACKENVAELSVEPDTDLAWLLDQTEKFCQEKAIYNSVMQSIEIITDKSGKTSKGAIPEILSNALSVSFDTHIGHDFFDDASDRHDFYHKRESRIPFDLDYFNRITNGGLPKKTLNIVLAGTNVGKSLFMCHCAAANLAGGLNVLYITMEMAEQEISKRIDANLLNISLDDLMSVSKETYMNKIARLRTNTSGKLIVKEYPTACAGSQNFRHLLNELKIKKSFTPDIIYIDYLNICLSSRLKFGNNVNSYTYVKTIAEELRGLAVEFNVPIMSATQTTRAGFSSSDPGLEDTSESFGLPATADFMFALMTSEELQALDQLMVKQLKNRYNDTTTVKRFVIGVDRKKMRLYDTEQESQKDISGGPSDDGPIMDRTDFGQKDHERASKRKGIEGFK